MGKSVHNEEWDAGSERGGGDVDELECEYVGPTPKIRTPARSPKKTTSATKTIGERCAPSTLQTKKVEKMVKVEPSSDTETTKKSDEDVVAAPQNTDAATLMTPVAAVVVDKLANYDKDAYKSHVTQMERRKARKRETEKVEKGSNDNSDDDDDDDEFDRPMRTIHGGYSHTKDAKKKIGLANKGKKPWNKGQQRSAEERAKISAAVRAHNRATLLKKLEGLGMTEEEWYAKKKKDKVDREKLRRKRLREERKQKQTVGGASSATANEETTTTTKTVPKDQIKATMEKEQEHTARMIADVLKSINR